LSPVAWLAIGTGTVLAMLLTGLGLKKIAENEQQRDNDPDSRFWRPRF
jgi:sulfite exporter TauE/SafE